MKKKVYVLFFTLFFLDIFLANMSITDFFCRNYSLTISKNLSVLKNATVNNTMVTFLQIGANSFLSKINLDGDILLNSNNIIIGNNQNKTNFIIQGLSNQSSSSNSGNFILIDSNNNNLWVAGNSNKSDFLAFNDEQITSTLNTNVIQNIDGMNILTIENNNYDSNLSSIIIGNSNDTLALEGNNIFLENSAISNSNNQLIINTSLNADFINIQADNNLENNFNTVIIEGNSECKNNITFNGTTTVAQNFIIDISEDPIFINSVVNMQGIINFNENLTIGYPKSGLLLYTKLFLNNDSIINTNNYLAIDSNNTMGTVSAIPFINNLFINTINSDDQLTITSGNDLILGNELSSVSFTPGINNNQIIVPNNLVSYENSLDSKITNELILDDNKFCDFETVYEIYKSLVIENEKLDAKLFFISKLIEINANKVKKYEYNNKKFIRFIFYCYGNEL